MSVSLVQQAVQSSSPVTHFFVAMEYYAVILNRTYVIRISETGLEGVLARGLISTHGGADPFTRYVTYKLAIHGDLTDPSSYVDKEFVTSSAARRGNFTISLQKIRAVEHDPSKKWGMGYYPHDGKVRVVTDDKVREFIVLGKQSGREVCAWIREAMDRANSSFEPTSLSGSV